MSDVTLNKATLSLVAGFKETLAATVAPDNATDKTVTWSSSDAAVAVVSETGEVSALKAGAATITATPVADKTKSTSCVVAVIAVGVGNFYYSDNTHSKTYDNTKTCIGIVYWIDPTDATKGKIVGLTEATGKVWGAKGVAESANSAIGQSIHSTTDGATATRKLIAAHKDASNFAADYSAFHWVYTTVNGGDINGRWYIPALDELKSLYGNFNGYRNVDASVKTTVNASLAVVNGAVPLSTDWYWSSTESTEHINLIAWTVRFTNQAVVYEYVKNQAVSVRAVSAF